MGGSGQAIERLHDATLIGIYFEWRSGRVSFEIETGDRQAPFVRIAGRDVSRFEIPREHPWGPSVSINEATLRAEGSSVRLEIEMQSGDTIIAIAEEFSVEARSTNDG